MLVIWKVVAMHFSFCFQLFRSRVLQYFSVRFRVSLVFPLLVGVVVAGARARRGAEGGRHHTIGDLCARVECAKSATRSVTIVDGKLVSDGKDLTPQFAAIDSFDVSLDRKEIVFSAKRKDNFDIGLVSLDGSDIHWVPEDPADEVGVQWAPRGNKVSFILHTKTGSIVRTVHIPTATPLSVDFPESQIDSLDWEPHAERFA